MEVDVTTTPAPFSLKQIVREKPFLFLILIEVLFFWRPIFLGEIFYFRDLGGHFWPMRELIADYIRDLELPLWDPYRQGGKPLLANPNNMVFNPANILYVCLNTGTAFSIEIIGYHLMRVVATYILCRMLSLRPASSFIGAMIYSFSGYSLSVMNLLNWHVATAYLPVLLCFWHLYLTRGEKIWWGLCVITASLQLFSGALEFSIFSLITLLGWGLFYGYQRARSQIVLAFILLVLFSTAVCAIQLFPAVENARVSIRGIGFGFDSATLSSLHPHRFPELIIHDFLGHYNSSTGTTYWGENLENRVPYFLSIYVGLPALAFVIFTILSRPVTLQERRMFHWFLLILFLAGLFLALGKYLPIFRVLFDMFSIRSPFRFPVKALAVSILPLCLLAATGAEILFSRVKNTAAVVTFWIIAIAIAVLLFSLRLSGVAILEALFQRTPNTVMQEGLTSAVLHTLLIWMLLCLCITIQHKKNVFPIVCLAVALDLFVAGLSVNFYAPRTIYSQTPPVVDVLKMHIQNGRLYRAGIQYEPGKTPTDEYYWRYWANEQTLTRDSAAKYRIPVIFHDDHDASALIELNFISVIIANLPWQQRIPVLAASGVKLILTSDSLNDPNATLVAKVANRQGKDFLVYSITDILAPLSFVSEIVHANAANHALKLMTGPGFDPAKQIVLFDGESRSGTPCGKVRVVQQELRKQSRRFVIEIACDGYAVFSDPRYPGWRTFVNGKEVETRKANIILSSVYLPAGRYDIRRTYLPDSVLTGACCSAVALAILVFFVFWRLK